jgi:beta-galactosidase
MNNKLTNMRKWIGLILSGLLSISGLAQVQGPRLTMNFDGNWELYALPSDSVGASAYHRGDSFKSQFNDEHISGTQAALTSIARSEVTEAIAGYAKEYPSIASKAWKSVSLPCPVRYEDSLNPAYHQFSGIAYYRKRFRLNPAWKKKYLYLHFDGAMQVASVWINGQYVTQHQGGYLPFNVPLSPYVRFDSTNEVVIRLDNRDNPNTPPGKPLASLGFLYWSGIYRQVWLEGRGPVHITDAVDPVAANPDINGHVSWQNTRPNRTSFDATGPLEGGGVFVRDLKVSYDSAVLAIRTQVMGPQFLQDRFTIQVSQKLLDDQGRLVVALHSPLYLGDSLACSEQTLRVAHPHLWSPDSPYLYRLVTLLSQGPTVLDSQSERIGIRWLEFTRTGGFTLNGRALRIVGTNRHQDAPYIGNALTPQALYRDLKRIKNAGMNFVRLAHYPQDPSVFEVCDSIGLMVVDPIPGWQFFNKNEAFTHRVMKDIRETVRRDRNHPCVIMWEMSLNESYPPDSFRMVSSEVAHSEYPGNQFFTAGDTYAAHKTNWDVPYNGWQDPFGRPQHVQPDAPGFVREYGHYEFGGEHSTTNANRSLGEASLLHNAWNIQWEHNLLRGPKYYPWTIGDANWAFYDGFEAPTVGTTDWGVMDVFRIPKFSYYFFQSQSSTKPMVYIANWWTPASSPDGKVVVYTNAASVSLYLNDSLVGTRKPDAGPDSPYGDWEHGGNPFDGGNAAHLSHPPVTFMQVGFHPGILKAVALDSASHPVTTFSVRTPGAAAALSIAVDTLGMPLTANGSDFVYVHASVVDAHGSVLVLDNTTAVSFSVSGPASIVGPGVVRVRGGIATVLVKAGTLPGLVRIHANAGAQLEQEVVIRER